MLASGFETCKTLSYFLPRLHASMSEHTSLSGPVSYSNVKNPLFKSFCTHLPQFWLFFLNRVEKVEWSCAGVLSGLSHLPAPLGSAGTDSATFKGAVMVFSLIICLPSSHLCLSW